MSPADKIRIGIAFFGIAIGGGLTKRSRVWPGLLLILLGICAVVISLANDQYRPLLAVICLLGVTYGLKWDDDGRRVIGLVGVSTGFLALLACTMMR